MSGASSFKFNTSVPAAFGLKGSRKASRKEIKNTQNL